MKINDSPILLVIDHFGSGGAQRQIVAIANGLVNLGFSVHIANYYPEYSHHRHNLDERIIVHDFRKKSKLGVGVIAKVVKLLNRYNFQSAMAFLDTPAFYLEIASMISFNHRDLFFSERSAIDLKPKSFASTLKKILHKHCRHITSNSMYQTEILKNYYGESKVSYVPNIMDDSLFDISVPNKFRSKNYIVLSHTRPFKNFKYVSLALVAYKKKYKTYPPIINWYGEIYQSKELNECLDYLTENGLDGYIVFHGAIKNVNSILSGARFLIHPSLFESSANAVAEALTSSTPIIVGDIREHKMMMDKSDAGYLVNLKDPLSLTDAIRDSEELLETEYVEFSRKARYYAEKYHKSVNIIRQYENLLITK